MKIEEVMDEFLLSMGMKLSTKNKYLKIDDYDYNAKFKAKTIKINDKEIKITKEKMNSIHFITNLDNVNNSFVKDIKNYDKKKLDELYKGEKYYAAVANYAISECKYYFIDHLRYALEKFDLNETNFKLIKSLVENSINTVNSISSVAGSYQKEHDAAWARAKGYGTALDSKTEQKIASGPKYVSLGYDGVFYENSAYTKSQIDSMYASNNQLAGMEFSEANRKLQEIADNYLQNNLYGTISRFDENFRDIIFAKYKNIFDDDIISGEKNIEVNPLYFDGWKEEIKYIKEDEFDKVKEVNELFDLNLEEIIYREVKNNIVEYYKQNKKCDYNGVDANLYLYLSSKKDFTVESLGVDNIVNVDIFNYFNDVIKNTSYSRKLNLETLLKEEKNLISECIYLSKEDIEELTRRANNKIRDFKERRFTIYDFGRYLVWAIVVILSIAGLFFDIGFIVKLIGIAVFIIVAIIISKKLKNKKYEE